MEREIQAYRQALTDDPGDREAFENLERLFVESRRWQDLSALFESNEGLADWERLILSLEEMCEAASEKSEKSQILQRVGEIWEIRVARADQAMISYQKAFKTWPHNTRALAAARTIYHAQKNWKMVLTLYQLELKVTREPEDQARIYTRLAALYFQEIGDENQGNAFLGKAIDLDPDSADAARLLDDPMASIGADAPAQTLPPEPDAVQAPADAAAEVTGVEASEDEPAETAAVEDEPVEAAPVEDEPAEAAPSETDAAAPVEAERDTAEAAEEAADAVEAVAPVEVAEPADASAQAEPGVDEDAGEPDVEAAPQRQPWEDEIDRIVAQAEAAGDPAIAGARYIDAVERALSHDRNYARVPDLLGKALDIAGDRVEVLKVASEYHRRREDWPRAAELLERQAAASSKTDRINLLGDLAQIYDLHLGNNERAVEIAEELLELDPTNPAALKAAEAKYSASGDWEKLVEIYDKTLRKMRRKPGEIDLLVGLAHMVWKRIGDLDRAEGYFKRLKLADSKNPAMLDFYTHYYREKKDWKRLLTALQNLKGNTDDTDRQLEIAVQMAEIAENELGNPEKAIDVWKQVLRLDGSIRPAREALATLYERTRKWNALLELIKDDISALGDDQVAEKVALYERMVEIYRDQLRLDVMVINTYSAILEVDPDNASAMDALAERYEQANRWNDLLGILQKKAESTDDTAEAVRLWSRIADLWRNRLTNTSRAISALETIVELDPTHADSIRQLHEIYEKRSDWSSLFSILQKEAMLVEGAERVAILEQSAELATRRLRDQQKAIEAWEAVSLAAAEPGGALTELEALYREAEDHEKLVSVYERMLGHATDDAERISVLDRLAGVYVEHLDDEDQAVALWRRMLPLEGGQDVALPRITEVYVTNEDWDTLTALYKERGAFEPLYDILEAAAEQLFDEDEQIALYQTMAAMAETELHDDEKVVSAYEAILELDPTHVETARALLGYYRKAGEPRKEAEANQIILAWTSDPLEALDLIREIGRLFEDELSDLAHAFEWYGKAVRKAPHDAALRAHYEDLAARAESQAQLVATYKEITEGGEALDDETVNALWRTVARTCQRDLDDPEQAVTYWERVLSVSGDDTEAIEALETLYEQISQWEKLLEILARRESLARSDAERVELSFKRARILLESERFEEAARSYFGVLDVDPTNLEAVRGVKQIHTRQQDWPALVEILQRELDLVVDDRPAILVELGDCYLQRLEEPETAIDFYSQLLAEDPGNETAVGRLEMLLDIDAHRARVARLLEPVYRNAEDWPSLANILEVRMEELNDPIDRCDLLWELYELRHDRLGDAQAAFDTVVRIFGQNPGDERGWDELERLADVVDDWDRVIELYESQRPESIDAEASRFALLRRLARIYETHRGDDEQARAAWELVLERRGEDTEAVDRLEALYTRASAHPQLVELLRHKAGLLGIDDTTRKQLYVRMASILEDVLDKPGDAVDAYREVLAVDQADADALSALERLYQAGARWDDLVELLRQQLIVLDDASARHDVRFKLGTVLEHQKQDIEGAIEAYSEVLTEAPEHDATRSSAEMLLQNLADLDEPDAAPWRERLTRVLEPIYVAEGENEKLVGVLEIRLRDTRDPFDRVELNTRIARLLRDQLNELEPAFEKFAAAVREDFGRADLRTDLEQLADVLQTWEQVIALYREGFDGTITDSLLQREIRFRSAQILESELGRDEDAIAAYSGVLELDDTDRAALNSLERLHEQRADWPALVAVLRKKAELEIGEGRVDLLRKIAVIEDEQLGDAEAAIETWREILLSVHGDPDALQALVRLYMATEDWPRLVEIYGEKSRLTEDLAERRQLFITMANVHEEMLEDSNEAILLFHRVLDLEPNDAEALDALDRLYESQERHADLGEILDRKLALAEDDSTRNALEFRLGQLYQKHLMGAERAIEYYRSILDRDPGYEPAIDALRELLGDETFRLAASRVLEPIYEQTGQAEALVDLLDLQLLDTQDPPTQVELLRRVAMLRQTQLMDAHGAFDAWARAMQIEPSGEGFREQLEALTDITGDYAELARVYRAVLPNVYDPQRMVSLRLRVAELARRLDNDEEAEEFYISVLDVEEHNEAALGSLEELYTAQGRWEHLQGILERRLDDHNRTPDERMGIIFRIAQIQEDMLSDSQGAVQSYRRVLQIDEQSPEARDALKRLFAQEGQWIDLVEVLVNDLRFSASDEETVATKLALAGVYRDQLGEDVQAVQTYREVLEVAPAQPDAVEALEQMFADGREALPIAELLEPIYRSQPAWAKLIGVLEVREQASYDEFEKAELLGEIVSLYEERLGQADKALEVAGRLFLSRPSDAVIRAELKRLAVAQGEIETWAGLFAQALEGDRLFDFTERKPIMLELASIRAERLGDHESGRQLWEDVLMDEPTNAEALDRLEWSYAQSDDWAALIDLYDRRVGLSVDPDERLRLLFKNAMIQEEVLGDPQSAVMAYRRVLEFEPQDSRATRSLERLLRSLREFDELAMLYRREMDFRTEADEIVELHHRLGTVLERELGRIADAIDSYRTALEMKPEHPASRRSLETLLRDLGQREEPEAADWRVQIAMLLERLYDEATDWEKLVDVYEVQLEQLDDPLSRVEILIKEARLFEQHDRTAERAFRAYARAVEISPSRRDVRGELERLAESLALRGELVDIYMRSLDACDDEHEKVAILLRIAQLNESELGKPDNAMVSYQEILRIEPNHPEALEALERLYRATGEYESLVEVLYAKAENTPDVWERKDILYSIAEIWEEELEQPTRAIDTYRRILEVVEEDQTALDALEGLYVRTEQWDELVEIYRRKIDLADDGDERMRLQFALASLHDEQRHDAFEAIETYRAILMDQPRNLTAIEQLDRLYGQEGRWVDLLDILGLELELATEQGDDALVNRVEFRIGRLLQNEMQDVPRAIGHYQTILDRDPNNPEAFDVLEQLLEHDDYRGQAAEVLEPLFEKLGHWDRLVDLYQVKLDEMYDPAARRELMLRTASIQEDMLGRAEMAFMLTGRTVKEHPRDETVVEQFERLAELQGSWDEAVAIYEELVEVSAADPDLVMELSLRLAPLYESRLGNQTEAVAKYEQVLEIDEFHRDALAELYRLYQQTGQWKALAGILQRRIDMGGDRAQVLEWRYQLGYLKEHQLDDIAGAIECYKNIIWDEPDHVDALGGLEGLLEHAEYRAEIAEIIEPIYTQQEDWAKLYHLLQHRLEVTEDNDDRFQMLRRMGHIARDQVQDDVAAFSALGLALELMPGDTQLVEEVQALAERLGAWSELAGVLDNAARAVDDPFTRRELNLKVATIYLEKLNDFDAAEAKYREVLENEPESAQALANLERIYEATERWPELLDVYEQRIDLTYDDAERKGLLYRSADVALNTLGDFERGVRYLQMVLELDETESGALDALEQIYEAQQSWEPLLEIVERKAALAMDGGEILTLRMKIGVIARDALGLNERAIEAFSNALDFDPSNLEILQALEQLYTETRQWAELQDNLMRQLSATEDQQGRLMLYIKCAAIASQFGDTNRAIDNLQQVLMLDPSNEDALTELERIYASENRFEELRHVLEQRLEQASSDQERVSLAIRIAQVAGKLGDVQTAVNNLLAVLEMQPDNVQALGALAGLYEDQGQYAEALQVLQSELEVTADPGRQAEIYVRIGNILYGHAGDDEQGEAAYVAALELNSANVDAIDALVKLYDARGDMPNKLRTMEYKVAALDDADAQLEMSAELADAFITDLGDYESASRHLAHVYANRQDLATAEKLLDAYIRIGAVAEAQPLLESIIEQLTSSRKMKKLPPFHHMRGQLAMQAGDEAAALESFKAAFDIDATYLPNLLDLGKFYYRAGELQDALKTFQTMLLHQMNIKDETIKVDMYYHLGMVRLQSGDERRARDMFNRALNIDGDHAPSKQALEQLG